jgi:hypothetical protein
MSSESSSEFRSEKQLEKPAAQPPPPQKPFPGEDVRITDAPASPPPSKSQRAANPSKTIVPKSAQRDLSDDEQPEIDDGTLSEVVRRPTRTAGDLSEVADASPGITTEDLARDLEAVASQRGVATESELLADLLRRVERIEQHLRIGDPQEPQAFDYLDKPSGEPPRRSGKQHPTVRSPGRED